MAEVNDADDPDLLDPAALGLYGHTPLKETSNVVECTQCGRVVAEQRFAAHLQTCQKVKSQAEAAKLEAEAKRREEVRVSCSVTARALRLTVFPFATL